MLLYRPLALPCHSLAVLYDNSAPKCDAAAAKYDTLNLKYDTLDLKYHASAVLCHATERKNGARAIKKSPTQRCHNAFSFLFYSSTVRLREKSWLPVFQTSRWSPDSCLCM